MAEHDLTQKIIPYLDRMLVYPLLQFLDVNKLYPHQDLLKAQYDLFSKTNMVDYTASIYKQIHDTDTIPEEFAKQREQVLKTLQDLESEAQAVLNVIENPDVVAALRQDKVHNLQFLRDKYDLTIEQLNVLYKLGKFQYSIGVYGGASDMLYHFLVLSTDAELNMSAYWGKLAADILDGSWKEALDDVHKLRELIDQKIFNSPLEQLQQRTWLIHWSLFVFFNHPQGRDAIVEMLFQTQYINTIQTSCPWILRYLTAAVVTNKRRRQVMKELVKIIQQEAYEYRDPITEFVDMLYSQFDFEGAQQKLKECEQVLSKDFFLVAAQEDFIENARYFISEAYCRIHTRIDIESLSDRLNMSKDEGEKWIVNLIRDTRVDAKIDFKEKSVIMNQNHSSVFQQVIEKTKGLSFRSQVLATTLDKREKQAIQVAQTALQAVSIEQAVQE